MSRETIRHFNSIINRITEVPVGVTEALRNHLFLGYPDPDKKIAQEYVTFVMDIAAGESISKAMLSDSRYFNARGGKNIGTTDFEPFWKECCNVLLPDSVTEECR